jgi:hypothetical protein
MTEQKLKDYINVVTGKARVKHAKKEPTPIEQFADKLIARNRRDHAKMPEAQARAAICRGC